MAEIKKKLDISVDIDKPVEEIKECIIAISIFHGPKQLEVLKQVEMWLRETIVEAERLNKEQSESNKDLAEK
jgi:hypothetical protein